MADKIQISAEVDFLSRQTRAEPIAALSELIWNSLDGDSTEVNVEFEYKDLAGGLSKIVIYDNGEGFSREEAKTLFGKLGGSWKRFRRSTKSRNRIVHGQEGKGRYKAIALGQKAIWKVCYQDEHKKIKYFEIELNESELNNVYISDEKSDSAKQLGTIVEIVNIRRDFKDFFSESGIQEICEIFALYLINYSDVKVIISGQKLDPQRAISARQSFDLGPFEGENSQKIEAKLDIIEWTRKTKRVLYFCNNEGFPLSQLQTRFHVGDFPFSAYLKSEYIEKLYSEGLLGLASMDEKLNKIVESAKQKIREYFRQRMADKAKSIVEIWKSENIYPYSGEATNPIEIAERQVFDIVAVSVQDFAPEIADAPHKTKALHLRMLKEAIEHSPSNLQLILKEVLQLPKRKQQELANLLQETSLSAIITAAKTVADRLKFIMGLESLVFDTESKEKLKERSQLHKIIAENAWIFGEEYNLWVSDKDLKRVLQKHKEHLDPNIVIDDPVIVEGQKSGIVDLMLSRMTRRHKAEDIEHLIVELKAPKVVIGPNEITQINKYALAVSSDERFKTVGGLRWHFWLVSNNYNDYSKNIIDGGPDRLRRLIFKKDNITVGIKTWGEIIEENKARLQFFQEHLQHNVSESEAIKYLQEKHKQFLEGVYDGTSQQETKQDSND